MFAINGGLLYNVCWIQLLSGFGDWTMRETLRRNQDTLFIIGTGVIAFGFWSVIKMCLISAFQTEEALGGVPDLSEGAATYIGTALFLAVDLCIRLYIGLSARAMGRDKKQGSAFIVLAALFAAFSAAAIIVIAVLALKSGLVRLEDMGVDLLISLIVEFTSIATLVDLVFSAVRVKRLKKALAEQE